MNDGGSSREERASHDGGRHVSPSLSLASLVGVSETWYEITVRPAAVSAWVANSAKRHGAPTYDLCSVPVAIGWNVVWPGGAIAKLTDIVAPARA